MAISRMGSTLLLERLKFTLFYRYFLEACLKALERIPGTSTGSSLKSINGGLITKRVEQMENKSAAGLDRSHIEVD